MKYGYGDVNGVPTYDPFTGGYAVTGSIVVHPYFQPAGAGVRFLKADSFQIISAGPNKIFGPGGNWTPGTGPWAENQPGNDDISNWTQRKLGVAE